MHRYEEADALMKICSGLTLVILGLLYTVVELHSLYICGFMIQKYLGSD